MLAATPRPRADTHTTGSTDLSCSPPHARGRVGRPARWESKGISLFLRGRSLLTDIDVLRILMQFGRKLRKGETYRRTALWWTGRERAFPGSGGADDRLGAGAVNRAEAGRLDSQERSAAAGAASSRRRPRTTAGSWSPPHDSGICSLPSMPSIDTACSYRRILYLRRKQHEEPSKHSGSMQSKGWEALTRGKTDYATHARAHEAQTQLLQIKPKHWPKQKPHEAEQCLAMKGRERTHSPCTAHSQHQRIVSLHQPASSGGY